MESRKIYEDLTLGVKRVQIVFIFVEVLFVFLVFYFWKIQIIDHRAFKKQSEANIMREVPLPAPRGLIVDREGDTILADNIASFQASIIRENCTNYELSCRRVARLLNIEQDVLKERIEKYKSLPLFKPIIVKDNLTIEEVSQIDGKKIEFPEVILQTEPKRTYPRGSFAAHSIGYLQEITEEEIKSGRYRERRLGDLVGRMGIEKVYEDFLRGTDGQLIEIVDSVGRVRGEIKRREPMQGRTLKLTIDVDLQQKAEELFQGREGGVIVLDAQSGEILALASYPTFDLNKFINRFTSEGWLDLQSDAEFPLENRVIRGLYAPGSIFKPVLALASLDSGLISEGTAFTCNGTAFFYGQPFSCWAKKGHGRIELVNAIRHSCNIYFYNLGKKLGIEEIARYAKMFGLGANTGVDLPGEKEGLVPDPGWKMNKRNIPWFPGETISVAIGQGPILVTPLQIAVYTSTIANRGRKIVPHLVKSYIDPITEEETVIHPLQAGQKVEIEGSLFEVVISGMWKAVNERGTAQATMISGFDVCGKTGSTQLRSTKKKEISGSENDIKTHSWFTGFAPKDEPKIVVTVIVEYGGMGGHTAAPLARELFKLYREKYD